MGRDAATDRETPPTAVGRVRLAGDSPSDGDAPPSPRDTMIKVALGVVAVLIMVGALALILQSAMGVAGP